MTVEKFISMAEQCHNKSIAVVRNNDKFLGIYKLPPQGQSKSAIELFDVTHYHGNYIDDYPNFTINLDTVNSLFIE